MSNNSYLYLLYKKYVTFTFQVLDYFDNLLDES